MTLKLQRKEIGHVFWKEAISEEVKLTQTTRFF